MQHELNQDKLTLSYRLTLTFFKLRFTAELIGEELDLDVLVHGEPEVSTPQLISMQDLSMS